MSKPTTLPRFAELDQVDPTSGQNNVVEPPANWKDYGWDYQEEPPRNYFNWLHRWTYEWLNWVDQKLIRTMTFVIAAYDSPQDAQEAADYVCDGADDDVEINAAIAAAAAAGGGIVFLAEGEFVIEGSIAITGNVSLVGQSREGTILKLVSTISASINMIDCSAASDFLLARFRLDGNKGAIGAYETNGINLGNASSRIILRDLHVTEMKNLATAGIGIKVASGTRAYFDNCRVSACGLHGIDIQSGAGKCLLDQCVIEENDDTGVRLYGDDSLATNSISQANGLNWDLAGNENGIESCQALDSDTYHGVTVGGTGARVQGCLVKGNYGHGIYLNGATDAQVHDNRVDSNSGSDANDGISTATCSNCSIQANVIRHGGGAAQHKYGINIDAGSSGVFVENNDARSGGKTANINDGGGATWLLSGKYVADDGAGTTFSAVVIDNGFANMG